MASFGTTDHRAEAEKFFDEAWAGVDGMTSWKDDGNFKIWTRQDTAANGTTSITACGEMAKMEASGEEFVPYFGDWAGNVCEVNHNVLEAAVVGKVGDAPVIRWVTKAPFPLSARCAFAACYSKLDDPKDLRYYMSSDGCQDIIKAQFFDVGEDATFALCTVTMSGWSVTPLEGGGVRVRYAYNADVGGNVPTFVANKKAPGIVDAALPGILAWITKRRA